MIFREQKPVPVEKLTEVLLRKHPVWEFCNDDEAGETLVRPVKKLPITSADSRLLACELQLADGSRLFGFFGNLSLNKKDRNQHFLTLSVFVNGSIEHLARYHDYDFEDHGPSWLAKKLRKKEEEIFPISYDLSASVKGDADCVRGSIPREPKTKLSRSEIIQLAVSG
ncbi:hypothetical protein CMV30_07775 [Nibricoccus aquaticus]|uniref:Uncharacterized protein n=1 Tax=Nibricoccus aquaticus TaxID=2576891 RepID=A0A290QIZ2_9BACT|nr:hypothetical protein [Nibricoccus aquaticus]ATC63852.1 hypothetical protein CMV30_07775 [Nibricoccus aquaticus]